MAYIPGRIKDEVVVVGNHRDGMLTRYLTVHSLMEPQPGYAHNLWSVEGAINSKRIGYGSLRPHIGNSLTE